MPTELQNILDLKDKYDTFIFDKWGVLWDGEKLFPGVINLFTDLKKAGKKIVILSNATMTASKAEDSLTKSNLLKGIHYDGMITSGAYLQHQIEQGFFEKKFRPNYTFYCFGKPSTPWSPQPSHICDSLQEADFVYLGPLTDTITPIHDNLETQNFLRECLRLNKIIVCANPDIYTNTKGERRYAQGAIADAYENMGGKVYWMGKPYPEIFDFTCQTFKTDKKKSVMVGDSLRTDIAGANAAGLDSILIHETGILAHLPKTKLPQEMKKEKAYPTYTLSRLTSESGIKKLSQKQPKSSPLERGRS